MQFRHFFKKKHKIKMVNVEYDFMEQHFLKGPILLEEFCEGACLLKEIL